MDTHTESKSLDAIVNAAGVVFDGPVLGNTDAQLMLTMHVNLIAPIRITRELLPELVRGPDGGNVINVASIAAGMAVCWNGSYASTKSGLQASPISCDARR